MTPEMAFEFAKREIMAQLPGLPEASIKPSANPGGAYVETRYLTLHLYYTKDKWVCCIDNCDEEMQFGIDFVLQLALDGWRNYLTRCIDRLDQYTSPPNLD